MAGTEGNNSRRYIEEKKIWVTEGQYTNSRGMKLFTCQWSPHTESSEIKAVICLLHGYAVSSSIYFANTAERLAENGYLVYGIDYEGHGKSEGLHGLVPDINALVEDCIKYFDSVKSLEECKGKPAFLFGESMGGAVAIQIHRKQPNAWQGAVFLAPMCKISDKLKPHPIIVAVLTQLATFLPKWKAVPTQHDVIEVANKDPAKREKIRSEPTTYKDKPRLGTAVNLLQISTDLEKNLEEVSLPFLVLHGEADVVVDPEISKELYKRATSTDKTLKMYPGMWHGLLEGELDDNIEIVFQDVLLWLGEKSKPIVA